MSKITRKLLPRETGPVTSDDEDALVWSAAVFPVIDERDEPEPKRAILHPGHVAVGSIVLVHYFVTSLERAKAALKQASQEESEGVIFAGDAPLEHEKPGSNEKWPINDEFLLLYSVEAAVRQALDDRGIPASGLGETASQRVIVAPKHGAITRNKDMWVPGITLLRQLDGGLVAREHFKLQEFKGYGSDPAGQ